MFSRIRELYLQSRKPHDIFWNTYVARPLAAVVLAVIARSPITPNQVTFLSLAIALVGCALLALTTSHASLIAAVVVIEVSYVFDCVDGQLARIKKMSSPVGAHLDFLMDEIKAYVVLGAAALRLAQTSGRPEPLWVGIVGLVIVASAISLTTFMRRPEYAPPPPPTGYTPPPPKPTSFVGKVMRLANGLAHVIAHYPTYLVVIAIFNRVEIFLYPYVAVHALYVLRSLAQIMVKLGRFAPAGVQPDVAMGPDAAVLSSLDQDEKATTIRISASSLVAAGVPGGVPGGSPAIATQAIEPLDISEEVTNPASTSESPSDKGAS